MYKKTILRACQTHYLQQKILDAQKIRTNVSIDESLKIKISEVCGKLEIDDLRNDIVINRVVKAYATYEKRTMVTAKDIRKIITLCLRYILRKNSLSVITSGTKVNETFEEIFQATLTTNN
jgi:magnesium chelatase subunit I